MAKLTIREKGRDRIYEICEDVVVVGTGLDCNVILRDPASSKLHCQIRKAKDGYRLVDLETKAGTQVNGEFVNQAALRSGDRVQVGDALIFFEDRDRGPSDSSRSGERTRHGTARRAGLPRNSVGGLAVAGVALAALVVIIGFKSRSGSNPDEALYRQATALLEQGRLADALAKSEEIETVPESNRTPWVTDARLEMERDIRSRLQNEAVTKVKGQAQLEINEIDKFARTEPSQVEEINARLDAWAAKYRHLFAEVPDLVERHNRLKQLFALGPPPADSTSKP